MLPYRLPPGLVPVLPPLTLSKIVRRRGGVREINESFDSEMTGAPSQDGSLVRVHTCP